MRNLQINSLALFQIAKIAIAIRRVYKFNSQFALLDNSAFSTFPRMTSRFRAIEPKHVVRTLLLTFRFVMTSDSTNDKAAI